MERRGRRRRDETAFCLTEEEQQMFRGEGQCLPDIALMNNAYWPRTAIALEGSELNLFQDSEFDRIRAMIRAAKSDNEKSQQLEIEIKSLRDREKSLIAQIEQLKEECEGLRKCSFVRGSALHQKQSELDKTKNELSSLQETLKVKDECLQKYNDTLRENEKQILDLERKISENKNKIPDLELEISHMKEEIRLQLERHFDQQRRIATYENDTKRQSDDEKAYDRFSKYFWNIIHGKEEGLHARRSSNDRLLTHLTRLRKSIEFLEEHTHMELLRTRMRLFSNQLERDTDGLLRKFGYLTDEPFYESLHPSLAAMYAMSTVKIKRTRDEKSEREERQKTTKWNQDRTRDHEDFA